MMHPTGRGYATGCGIWTYLIVLALIVLVLLLCSMMAQPITP